MNLGTSSSIGVNCCDTAPNFALDLIEEQQQCAVAKPETALVGQSSEEGLDFVTCERAHDRLRAALDWDRRDLLAIV